MMLFGFGLRVQNLIWMGIFIFVYAITYHNLPSDSSRQSLVDEELFDRICNYVNSLKNATEKNVTL